MRSISFLSKILLRLKLSIFALALIVFGDAYAIPVDLEIALGVDVSPSVDTTEFNLQRQGYVDAFNNPLIQDAINSGAIGSVAVNFYYWDFNIDFQTGYTLIDDGTNGLTASDFANIIASTSRGSNNGTGIANAISFGAASFVGNGFEGNRFVIDISGDGEENGTTLGGLQSQRDSAEANGITINGLPILGSDFPNLDNYYVLNIQTSDGFTIVAADFPSFGNAVLTKLESEIRSGPNPVPVSEPTSSVLLLIGIISFFYSNYQRIRNRSYS